MKGITAALLAALVAVLSVIAYDLHRVAVVLAPHQATTSSSSPTTERASDEHERRVQQAMRMLCDLQDCDHSYDEAQKRLKSSRR